MNKKVTESSERFEINYMLEIEISLKRVETFIIKEGIT